VTEMSVNLRGPEAGGLSGHIERVCPRLRRVISRCTPEDRDTLVRDIAGTPSGRLTAARLDDLLGGTGSQLIERIALDRSTRRLLIATVGGSRFLFSILDRNPALLDSVFVRAKCLFRKTRSIMQKELHQKLAGVSTTADADRMLRLYKEEEYLRIGCRDLTGRADVEETMLELSQLAGACVQAAMDFHRERLAAKHGLPEGVGAQGGLVAMGMGKVSGNELNFSSDVDLIFIRGPEEGKTLGRESISVSRFYETLVRSVTRSLSDITEDGFVFRIDLRLRPEGDKGELVPSLANAVDYYLGWGRTWERAALMKAVPLAGDLELGSKFVEELEPFIYRKHLDFSTLEDMRSMKRQIALQLKRKPGVNIKLGHGGIREIEFFVQALQLINGGRTPRIRCPSTLRGLALLARAGILDEGTAKTLREAYRFFRLTEHRIQINHQLQTHELPRTLEEQEDLARRIGYEGGDALPAFLLDLEAHRRVVEELFSSLFYQSREETLEEVAPDARRILESIHDEVAAQTQLARHGFDDPAGSYAILKELAAPSRHGAPGKGMELLERLAPLLVDELLKAPEPSHTLLALSAYIDSLKSGPGYFSTFLENPPTIRFLVRILGESRFFAELLIRHPQAIDSLIARTGGEYPRERESLVTELSERLAYCEDFESKLDVLRRFKNEELLMIGVRHIQGEIESCYARWLISELAEACLEAAVNLAAHEMARRYGGPEEIGHLPFAVLAMGKLGGAEMTYHSDLDVIFIYGSGCDTIGRLPAHEWFTRLANRIISILSAPTSEGSAFTIDARLRPSGNKGPLVCSLDSFRDYHRTTSQLWEKQALIRARSVIGPPDLTSEVEAIALSCILRTELSEEDIREIARLRSRIENELALEDESHVDVKTGRGGLVDVEFFVQGTILKYGRRNPKIICSNTLEALEAERHAGLLERDTFEALHSGYRFLSNLEDRLRIIENRSVDRMPLSGEKVKGLAARLGYGPEGGEKLIEDYFSITRAIRATYSSFFGDAADENSSSLDSGKEAPQ
jgi:glutamate-ammonia-ligase adenylyltransferase